MRSAAARRRRRSQRGIQEGLCSGSVLRRGRLVALAGIPSSQCALSASAAAQTRPAGSGREHQRCAAAIAAERMGADKHAPCEGDLVARTSQRRAARCDATARCAQRTFFARCGTSSAAANAGLPMSVLNCYLIFFADVMDKMVCTPVVAGNAWLRAITSRIGGRVVAALGAPRRHQADR